MTDRIYHVLFLCTGNSARSILAECALNRLGEGRFRGFSAGSHPKPAPHPVGLTLLRQLGYDTTGLRSKSWDEFAKPGAPSLDLILTVCDGAAGEACPIWPGKPLAAHWGVEDPAAFAGPAEQRRPVFQRVYRELERRIELLAGLPLEGMSRASVQTNLDDIGRARADAGELSGQAAPGSRAEGGREEQT